MRICWYGQSAFRLEGSEIVAAEVLGTREAPAVALLEAPT
jgi:hypothetical protein